MPFEGKREAMQGTRDKADKFVRAFGLEAFGRLIKKTPVDKGTARANWNVGVGKINRSTKDEATIADVPARMSEGQAKILSEFRAGGRLLLTNSLPYIGELEDGSSQQAPQGMVKVTVKELGPLKARIAAEVFSGG